MIGANAFSGSFSLKKVLPALAPDLGYEDLDISDGSLAGIFWERLVREHKLEGFPYVVSPVVGMTYQVGKLPYAVLIDELGIVRAKGLVNSREHLESLLVAKETGYASIQAWLDADGKAPNEARRPRALAAVDG